MIEYEFIYIFLYRLIYIINYIIRLVQVKKGIVFYRIMEKYVLGNEYQNKE